MRWQITAYFSHCLFCETSSSLGKTAKLYFLEFFTVLNTYNLKCQLTCNVQIYKTHKTLELKKTNMSLCLIRGVKCYEALSD